MNEITGGQVVAIDGKKLLGSQDGILGRGAINMVSAWASENELVLGQVKVDDKSNEITAILQLVRVLELTGGLVTIDAIGCQKEIAETIIEQGADYILEVKENQGNLYEDIADVFAGAQEFDFQNIAHTYHKTVDGSHGRIEVLRYSPWWVPVFWGVWVRAHPHTPKYDLLKQDRSVKAGVKAKRHKAGWDNDFLLHLLAQ